MIRVLQVVSNMDRAGIETMLMNYYRNVNKDIVQFDFLCNKSKKGAYDKEIIKMGGKIFRSPGLNPLKFSKYKKFMDTLFSEHPGYNIIHVHNGALGQYALYCSKKNNIKIRIFHAHGASIAKDYKYPLKIICKSRINKTINYRFACSTEAAKCYFGEKFLNNFIYVHNAIDIKKFTFNQEVRDRIRLKYNLQDKFVIGHIGRFVKQKKHEFVIKMFYKFKIKNPNSILILLGDGALQSKMIDLVKKLKLEENVLFIGNVNNVNEWYQAFDVFVLPSLWEGLPVVGIEAQASDLKCLFSESITKEVSIVKENAMFLSNKIDVWVNEITKIKNMSYQRIDRSNEIKLAGYDILTEAKKLENLYIKLNSEEIYK